MPKSLKLTDSKIQGLRVPVSGQVEVSDALVPGLRVRIGASGVRTFVMRKRVGGQMRNMTIGRYTPMFGLADARKKARELLNEIDSGIDPYEDPAFMVKGGSIKKTVRGLWPDYRKAKADKKSIREIERIFDRLILPKFGDRLAPTITRAEITRFIDKIRSPYQARNVLSIFSSFYSWALPRLDELQANPCRDAGRPPAPKLR